MHPGTTSGRARALVLAAVLLASALASPLADAAGVATNEVPPTVVRTVTSPLSGPRDVAVTPDGDVLVVDAGDRILRAGPDLVFDTTIGGPGTAAGEFADPEGIAVAPDGDLFVADTGNDRIQRLDAAGTFELAWGGPGTGTGQFDEPAGVAVGTDGDVWVADRGNGRVQRFHADGTFVGAYGSSASLFRPTGLVVGPDAVYVATSTSSVGRVSLGGTVLPSWPTQSGFGIRGVDVDAVGRVWATGYFDGGGVPDLARRALFHLDRSGRSAFDGDQSPSGSDAGLAVGAGGLLYIVDQARSRLTEQVATTSPLVQVELVASRATVLVGRAVDYEVTLANTGTAPLTGLALSWSLTAECNGPVPDLGVGQSTIRRCTHLASAADVGTFANRVTVTATGLEAPGVQTPQHIADVSVQYPPPPSLGELGGPGTGPGQLGGAADLDVTPDGTVHVLEASSGGAEVDRFRAGRWLGAVPVPYAWRLAVDPADGDLYAISGETQLYGGYSGTRSWVERDSPSGAPLGEVAGTRTDSDATDLTVRPSDGHVLVATVPQRFESCDLGFCSSYSVGRDSIIDADPTAGTSTVGTGSGVAIVASGDRSYALTGTAVSVRSASGDGRLINVGPGGTDLDVDGAGNVYVSYRALREVRAYSGAGVLLGTWSTRADRLAVGPDGTIYTLDIPAAVVRVFGYGVSGVVADEVTDLPLAAVVAVAVDATGRLAAATVTGPDGSYRLRVGAGQYRVGFIDPSGAHQGEWAWGHPLSSPTAAAAVSVGATGMRVDIGLLPARGSLAGVVTADGGGAVPGAWVGAIDLATGVLRGTVAGGDGAYSLAALPVGSHLAAVVDPSGTHRFEFHEDALFAPFADAVVVTAGQTVPVSAALAAQGPLGTGGSIQGTVTEDAGGAPVPGAWVVAVRTDGALAGGAVTGPSGAYSIAVGPGSYRVQVLDPAGEHAGQWVPNRPLDDYDHAQVVTVASSPVTVDVGVASNRGSLRGTVSGPAGPAAGTVVLAISAATGQVGGAATATGDGSYAVAGLLPGRYLVAFLDPMGELGLGFEYHADTTNPGTATPVTVTAAAVTTVDAALG